MDGWGFHSFLPFAFVSSAPNDQLVEAEVAAMDGLGIRLARPAARCDEAALAAAVMMKCVIMGVLEEPCRFAMEILDFDGRALPDK
jgi:hypothetical protein